MSACVIVNEDREKLIKSVALEFVELIILPGRLVGDWGKERTNFGTQFWAGHR